MSVLSSRQIKALIEDPSVKLIEPDPRQLSDPILKAAWDKGVERVEGVNFELSIGKVFRKESTFDSGFIGVNERRTPKFKEEKPSKKRWFLREGFYEVQTFEKINQPLFLASRLVAKRTLITFGAQLIFADVAPGYSGKLGIGLYVFPDCKLPIEQGALFMSVSFYLISDVDGVEKWDGVWKDSKMFISDEVVRPR